MKESSTATGNVASATSPISNEIHITRPEGMDDEDWATLCRILTVGLVDIVEAIKRAGR